MNDDFDERIQRVDTGVSIEISMTRGTGTRDQEKIKAKVKAESLPEARDDINALKPDLEQWAKELRAIQPDDDGDES